MALTKVTGQVVNTSTDLTVGVLTATTASFTGNVSVGGTLTYEDVTNVDSVGLITARNGISVTGSNISVESSEDRLLYLKSTDANAYLTFEDTDSSSGFANRIGSVSDGLYFSTGGGGERARIDSSGNFGLGVSSPDSPFHVSSSTNTVARFESTDSVSRIVLKDNSGEIRVGATGDNLTFHTSSSETERARIDSSGRLLIGATSTTGNQGDADILIVGSSTQGELYLSRGGGPGNTGSGLGFIKFTGNNGQDAAEITCFSDGGTWTNGSSHPTSLRFTTTADGESSTTERMRIDSGGRLLIGTTADKSISSDVNALVQIFTSSAGKLLIGRSDASVVNNDYLGIIDFHTFDGGSQRGARIAARADGDHASGDVPSRIEFSTCADGSSTLTERMRIDNSGRIFFNETNSDLGHKYILSGNESADVAAFQYNSNTGTYLAITTGAPNGIVEIRADARSGSFPPLTFKTGANERVRIDSSGNFGIGVANPGDFNAKAEKLVLANGGDDVGITLDCDTDKEGSIYFADGSTGDNLRRGQIVYNHDGDSLRFVTNASEHLRISSSGDVGIGISSPALKLHVDDSGSQIIRFSRTGVGAGSLDVDSSGNAVFNSHTTSKSVVFHTQATERARIDSSGRLLLGVSTSSAVGFDHALQVEGTSGASSSLSLIRNSNDTNGPHIDFASTRGTSTRSNTVVQNGDDLGNIVFRGADGTDKASIAVQIQAEVDGAPGSNDMPGRLIFKTTSDGGSSPTERMRVRADGRILMNCTQTSDTGILQLRNTVGSAHCLGLGTSASGADTLVVIKHGTAADGSGGTTVGTITCNSTSTAYGTSSDYRLKENVVNLAGAIDRVKQLAPKQFNFIADPNKVVDGFLAHEAQAVVPEAVYGTHNEVDDDGNAVMQVIDTSKLVPLLTAALQEAIAEIETLKTKVAALEG